MWAWESENRQYKSLKSKNSPLNNNNTIVESNYKPTRKVICPFVLNWNDTKRGNKINPFRNVPALLLHFYYHLFLLPLSNILFSHAHGHRAWCPKRSALIFSRCTIPTRAQRAWCRLVCPCASHRGCPPCPHHIVFSLLLSRHRWYQHRPPCRHRHVSLQASTVWSRHHP